MNWLTIWIAALACIFVQRYWYIAKMHRIGAALIGEAYKVRGGWPDEYPDYCARAVASLNDHGCADLVQYLPSATPPQSAPKSSSRPNK